MYCAATQQAVAPAHNQVIEHTFTSDQVRRNLTDNYQKFFADFEMNSHLATFQV
jgi:hypothetical protein